MRVLLFLLIFHFVLTSGTASDQLPIINITVTRNSKGIVLSETPQNCCVINFSNAFKVMVYMPRQMKKKIQCFDAQNGKNIISSVNLREHSEGYYYTIQKATAFMATEWQCQLFSKSEFFTRSFKVHVRGQGLGILYINNHIVRNSTEYTTFDYDKYVIYNYIDGEMTPFKCSAYENSSSSQILYRNQGEQFEVVDNKEAVLYLRLTKEHNGTYLDCKVTKKEKDGLISSIIRVYFQIKTTLDIPRFMINEMVLTPVSQSSPEYNPNNPTGTFVYNYYNHENVIIRTFTGNSSSLSCSNDKTPSQTVNDINLKTTLREHDNNMKLTCTMKDNQQQKNVTMTLSLKYVASSDFYPLSGLSWANVLTMYKRSDIAVVIKYSYRVNKLLLTCHKGIQWKFDRSQIRSESFNRGYEENSGKFWETKWFEMKSNYNRSNVTCFGLVNPLLLKQNEPSAEVELIRDGPLQFEDVPETDIVEYFNSNSKESFFKKNLKLLFISCATAIVATIVIALAVYLNVKRVKQTRKDQFFSPHHKFPMPLPQQLHCENDDVTESTSDDGENIHHTIRSGADNANAGHFFERATNEGEDGNDHCSELVYDYVYDHW